MTDPFRTRSPLAGVFLGAALLALQTGCGIAPMHSNVPGSEAASHAAAIVPNRLISMPHPPSDYEVAQPPEAASGAAHISRESGPAMADPPASSTMSRAAAPKAGELLADAARAETLISGDWSEKRIAQDPPIDHLGAVVDARPATKKVDLTVEPDDLWERIRKGFAMPDLRGPLVRDRENWYASQARALEAVLERSKLYLYHIVEELEERGMPMELALLPLVESSFDPMATSRANASGLWQFIPSTGRRYNLRQDHRYDARRDIVASTDAALDYLGFLYQMHGDWHLALASYNWGENAVARAIERNRAKRLPTDYSSLPMPRETHLYVPKLQALKNIISHPARFRVDLDAIPNRPFFVSVKVEEIDVRLAAKLAEMPVENLMALNPGNKGPVFQGHRTAELLLPAGRVKKFLANLSKHKRPLVSWQRYRLKPSDSLTRLAALHGISLAELRKANGIHTRSSPRPGALLLLPIRSKSPVRFARLKNTAKAATSSRKGLRNIASKAAQRAGNQARR